MPVLASRAECSFGLHWCLLVKACIVVTLLGPDKQVN